MIPVHDVQRESRWIDHISECYTEIDRLNALFKKSSLTKRKSYADRFDIWMRDTQPTFWKNAPKNDPYAKQFLNGEFI